MYPQVCTRPDIAFVVNALGRYLSDPGLDHWKAIKKVFRYLQGTKDHMLTFKNLINFKSLVILILILLVAPTTESLLLALFL